MGMAQPERTTAWVSVGPGQVLLAVLPYTLVIAYTDGCAAPCPAQPHAAY